MMYGLAQMLQSLMALLFTEDVLWGGAVATKDIPEYSVAMGVPAKVIK